MIVMAPWSEAQVAALNTWNASGYVHPFTCAVHSDMPLVATIDGWRCHMHCGYRQDWAHNFMMDGSLHGLMQSLLNLGNQP